MYFINNHQITHENSLDFSKRTKGSKYISSVILTSEALVEIPTNSCNTKILHQKSVAHFNLLAYLKIFIHCLFASILADY